VAVRTPPRKVVQEVNEGRDDHFKAERVVDQRAVRYDGHVAQRPRNPHERENNQNLFKKKKN
jgi:hypothetical protein